MNEKQFFHPQLINTPEAGGRGESVEKRMNQDVKMGRSLMRPRRQTPLSRGAARPRRWACKGGGRKPALNPEWTSGSSQQERGRGQEEDPWKLEGAPLDRAV